jgi:hypothetical protein
MNWITTNIRFPEDLYMELKMEAAASRKSVAALVRERVSVKKNMIPKKTKAETLLKEMDKFAKRMAKKNKGIDFTQGLIKMRYEL